MLPKFSIIMPIYNAENTLEEALSSVLSQLTEHDELIAVDDASADNSLALLKQLNDPRIKIIEHAKNQGIAGARNSALPYVSGDYVAFMDSDDVWPEGRHRKVLEVIKAEDPEIISGQIAHFYCPSLSEIECLKYKCHETKHACIPGSVVFKRSMIEGRCFDTSLKAGEFIDYMSRTKAVEHQHVRLDQVFLKRRIHRNNTTLRERQSQVDYLKVIRNHMKRATV